MKEDGQWFTEDIFSNVFKFTQLLSSEQTGYDTMCTPFLYLRSGNSSVCKLRSTIRFSPIACSTLIAQMFPVYNWNNNSFVETLSKLPRHEVFSFIANGSQSVNFPAVNSDTSLCKVKIDNDFKSTLQNIYASTAIMFQNFESLLKTLFPQPLCQLLKFNMSKLIQLNMPLYEKFPRVLAKFINRHLKVQYACIMFQNDAAAPVLPDVLYLL